MKEEGRIVHRRMPSLAAGPDGELHLAFFSDESGSNDVILRSFSNGTWGPDIQVAATKADEYAPSVAAAGKGAALVAYVSNEGGRYDIWTVLVRKGKPLRRQQVTRSRDDAMAPVLCGGPKAAPWLAWYEWAKMGDLSRDREVFAAASRMEGWSRPIQVSPREVPAYEDHADPAIFTDWKGGAWVAWAWDYHGTWRTKPPVDENSIFVRHVDRDMKMGEVLAAGFRGSGRARDYAPTLATTPAGVPHVAWDNSHKASLGYNAKAIFVNHLSGRDFAEQIEAAATEGSIDSPRLLPDPKGGLHLMWCQETRAGWELWTRKVDAEELGSARRLEVSGKTPRYPSAAFDSEGQLWIAYTDTSSSQWQICVEAMAGR